MRRAFAGPNLSKLSMDAGFAITNMTTVSGGIGDCFEANGETVQ